MRPFLFSVIAGCVAATSSLAAERVFASGPDQVSLIELYTSEGCSSCPPAERWLGSLRDAPGLWRDFVPVALHVNYWDRLGWPDRFATKEFTQREQAYAAKWKSSSVYTPCFVRDGSEWRHESRPPAAPKAKAGVLTISLGDDGLARVEFSPAAPRRDRDRYDVHVAILGGGFISKVTAGENRGENLRHEFVALALETHPLGANSETLPTVEFSLPLPAITDAPRKAVAFWVTRRGELAPLQATGGWLER